MKIKRKVKCAVLAAMVAAAMAILPGTASAAEWFVSPDGSDAASGLSSAPFRTINHAISRASANDTITLLPGEFVVFFPPIGGHNPGCTAEGKPRKNKKICVKVKIA